MARQARKTAAQVASKWGQNLGGSTASMTNGVQGVTVAPTQLAANQAQAYVAGVQQAVASGKWQQKLNAVSLQQWRDAYVKKGIPRVQQAATTDQAKVQAAMGPLLDYIYGLRDQINSSQPRGSLAQNIQRATAMMQGMANYKTQ
jgi:hypothetical protein